MEVQVLPWYVALLFVFLCSFLSLKGQESADAFNANGSNALPTGSNNNDHASIFIYYPFAKSGSNYAIYLNRKNIGKLSNGGRIECRLLLEGPVAITLIEGNTYLEPLTQSKNSRTITVTKGKTYYFRVNGTGGLEYIFNAEKGKDNFSDSKDFVSQPGAFVETTGTGIPLLKAVSN